MAISDSAPWEQVAADKVASLIATIPQEWIIPTEVLPSPKQLDITTFPQTSGWFTTEELEITASTAGEILSKVRTQTWSAVSVTRAFCKRAAAAHQLVSNVT